MGTTSVWTPSQPPPAAMGFHLIEEIMSHRTLLKAACMALWGPNYRSELARNLDVHLRTAMRWDRGESGVPQSAWDALFKLLEERQKEIDKVLSKIPTGDA